MLQYSEVHKNLSFSRDNIISAHPIAKRFSQHTGRWWFKIGNTIRIIWVKYHQVGPHKASSRGERDHNLLVETESENLHILVSYFVILILKHNTETFDRSHELRLTHNNKRLVVSEF